MGNGMERKSVHNPLANEGDAQHLLLAGGKATLLYHFISIPCRHPRNGVIIPVIVGIVLCFLSGFCSAEELRLCTLKQGQHFLPSLPAPLLSARGSGAKPESLQLAQEDYLERMKKRPRLQEEIWTLPAGEPKSATLCVIHNLTETAGISFLIPQEKPESTQMEIHLPKGPDLGPFSLSLNGKELETIDPWAPERTQPEWIPLKKPVELKQGNNVLTLTQKSPQDLPIWIEAIRIEGK